MKFITRDDIEWEIDEANFRFRTSKNNDWIEYYQFKPIRVGKKVEIETKICGWAGSYKAVKRIFML